MLQIPGKRTRKLLFDAGNPPGVVWMRLSVAGLACSSAIPMRRRSLPLCRMSVVVSVEMQVARALLKVFDAAKRLIRARGKPMPPAGKGNVPKKS
jgi:hypothetical protein